MGSVPDDPAWLISVDDHVIEPPSLWVDRLPRSDRDRGPRVMHDETGMAWRYEDKRVPLINHIATAGKTEEQRNAPPAPMASYDEMRPGCYDPSERVKDMDRAGVLASLPFPTFPRFCGQEFLEASDRGLAFRCVKAYNDWMIEEWCGTAPGRFIPLIILPLWDPALAASEIDRCAGRGAKAVAFSENPAQLGLPSIHDRDRYWDPVWRAAGDASLPICTHLGSSSRLPSTSRDSPTAVTFALATLNLMSTCIDWLFSDNFIRFPQLRLCLSEGGISWIPAALERCEQVLEEQGSWIRSADAPAPRDLFHEHVFGCTIRDRVGIALIEEIGVDNVMLETDYPHGATSWPDSIGLAHELFKGLSPDARQRVFLGNAQRVFNFEPVYPGQASTSLASVPMPSISTSTRSPGSTVGGSGGDPSRITSPGSSVHSRDR
jgi:predicted TIM-barrel fold metal-dependent hydrolase